MENKITEAVKKATRKKAVGNGIELLKDAGKAQVFFNGVHYSKGSIEDALLNLHYLTESFAGSEEVLKNFTVSFTTPTERVVEKVVTVEVEKEYKTSAEVKAEVLRLQGLLKTL